MAEIVGLVASIATLAEVAGKTGSTISRIRKLLASPPRYIEAAQNEIKGFSAALNIIQDILEGQDTPPPEKAKLEIDRLHAQATVALQEFDSFLQRKVLRGGSDGGSISLRRRAIVKEVFGEAQAEFNDFQQQLVSIKLNLQLVLQTLQLYNHQTKLWHLQRVSVIRAGVTTTIDANHRDVTTAFVEEAVTTSAATTIASAGANDDCIVFEMQPPGQRCRSRCPCQCHIGLQGSTPRWLRGLIGTLFYDLSGVPIINRRAYNFKLCGGATEGLAHVQYVLPTWILPCAIEATASWRTLDGTSGTWSLIVPRYINRVTVYNSFKRLAQHGTVAEFQELMSESEMRAFDIFDSSFDLCSTLFALAVDFSRPDICHMLLEAGADVSYRDPCGMSLAGFFWLRHQVGCTFASLSKHPKLIEAYDTSSALPGHDFLINNQLDALVTYLDTSPLTVTLKDDHGFTLLHWASMCGNVDATHVLIAAGADVNVNCNRGQTPLLSASVSGRSLEICEALLRAGADVNLTDLEGNNALIKAINSQTASLPMVRLLLEAGTNVHYISGYNRDALETLALVKQGPDDARVCTLLLDHGITPVRKNDYGWNSVARAIDTNNYDVLEVLIQRGAALNTIAAADRTTNITVAASSANVRTIQLLRDARIQGLPMDAETVQGYWDIFDERDETFLGVRDPIEEEEVAFQELLDSIIPMGPSPVPTSVPEKYLVPGSFPREDDDSSYADSSSEDDDDSSRADSSSDNDNAGTSDKIENHGTQDSEDSLDALEVFSDDEDNTLVDDVAVQLPSCQHQTQALKSPGMRKDSTNSPLNLS